MSNCNESRLKPASSDITCPPVSIAISSNIDFLLSPNPGALTATTLTIPLSLFTTKVANASFSKSSATISKGLDVFATNSKTGTNSC